MDTITVQDPAESEQLIEAYKREHPDAEWLLIKVDDPLYQIFTGTVGGLVNLQEETIAPLPSLEDAFVRAAQKFMLATEPGDEGDLRDYLDDGVSLEV